MPQVGQSDLFESHNRREAVHDRHTAIKRVVLPPDRDTGSHDARRGLKNADANAASAILILAAVPTARGSDGSSSLA